MIYKGYIIKSSPQPVRFNAGFVFEKLRLERGEVTRPKIKELGNSRFGVLT